MAHERFADLPDSDVRSAVLEALSAAARNELDSRRISRDSIANNAARTLLLARGFSPGDATTIAHQLVEEYKQFGHDPRSTGRPDGENADVVRIESAIWELVRRGIVYPRMNITKQVDPVDPKNPPWSIQWLVLTPTGARLIREQAAHPSHSDFVGRAVAACSGLPQEVIARLEDAHDCFSNGLYRASVVMLRLAYEQMIRALYDDHDIENHVPGNLKPGKRPTASTLLDGLVHVLRNIPDPPEGIANMAMHIADVIRLDGNAAAHDWTRNFADAGEVEELLILAGRNVSRLWSMKVRLP